MPRKEQTLYLEEALRSTAQKSGLIEDEVKGCFGLVPVLLEVQSKVAKERGDDSQLRPAVVVTVYFVGFDWR
ncbi:hypothetical protein TWF281_000886 [Arthrobotrys megalospora]